MSETATQSKPASSQPKDSKSAKASFQLDKEIDDIISAGLQNVKQTKGIKVSKPDFFAMLIRKHYKSGLDTLAKIKLEL